MLKRITKVTSLLVCAASIVSIVPAFAADVKKYDSNEGTVYSAKAKGAGIYIDGEINDKDEAQYFITPDGKYNAIDGIDAGMAVDDLLLGQYLIMDDGDTVVDIKDNYKLVDDKTRADLQDDVSSTIRKKIKADNDGRFAEGSTTSGQTDYLQTGAKFLDGGSGLSMYNYTLKSPGVSIKTADAVYVDYAGNYVDADYNLGSVKVTTTGGSITFKNTEDTYELKEGSTTYEYRAVIQDGGYATVISDNVYRWANLSIYKKVKDADDSTYTNVTNKVAFGTNGYNSFVSSGSAPVLQRFSKTVASDNIGGIKYSKDAATYFVADSNGKSEVVLGRSKSDSATKVGVTLDSTNDGIKLTGNDKGFCSAYYSRNAGKVYAQTLNLKSKDGFNYVDLGDTDNANTSQDGICNAGGLVYALDSGYVKVWDGDSNFTKLYKVDGSFNRMSVGSKDIIALWNEDDSLYTVINNAGKTGSTTTTGTTDTTTTTTTTTTTGTTTTATATGWVKAANGTWSYNKADGTKSTGWLKDGAAWYYLKSDGAMATGWIQDGSTWYYLNASGSMQTGWINDNGTWYYCNASGAMLANTTVDGYVLGGNGAWIK